jgi:hypothetical protein
MGVHTLPPGTHPRIGETTLNRTLLYVVGGVAVVAVVVGLLYAFGTPQTSGPVAASPVPVSPQAGDAGAAAELPPAGPQSGAEAEAGNGDTGVVEGAEAPPPDPSTPLAIEIPGCVCHSDDPEVVEEHARYRMNQCAGCHIGGTPTGQ